MPTQGKVTIMDEDFAYDEQFSPDELGRSGNEIIRVQRDRRVPEDTTNTHWDVTERDPQGDFKTFHVLDDQQSWIGDHL